MELGEKLKQARLEAGLSQRQLCADVITRNMLSQIEHGTARPSMDTLRYLAGRLSKPVSYFLEEDVVTSPNQELIARAGDYCAAGDWAEAKLLLQAFRQPDPVLEWQWRYLSAVTAMEAARQAAEEGRHRYARQLLEEAGEPGIAIPELERRRLLMLGTIPGADPAAAVRQLPPLDEELLLRAEAARSEGDFQRAQALLMAAEDQRSPRWNLLQGQVFMARNQYSQAIPYLEQAEAAFPEPCWPLLEEAFRELGDFQKAYLYVCKQR